MREPSNISEVLGAPEVEEGGKGSNSSTAFQIFNLNTNGVYFELDFATFF